MKYQKSMPAIMHDLNVYEWTVRELICSPVGFHVRLSFIRINMTTVYIPLYSVYNYTSAGYKHSVFCAGGIQIDKMEHL